MKTLIVCLRFGRPLSLVVDSARDGVMRSHEDMLLDVLQFHDKFRDDVEWYYILDGEVHGILVECQQGLPK